MSNRDDTPEKPGADAGPGFAKSTRRTFISRMGVASLLATADGTVTTFG